jgi:hypothetical protein
MSLNEKHIDLEVNQVPYLDSSSESSLEDPLVSKFEGKKQFVDDWLSTYAVSEDDKERVEEKDEGILKQGDDSVEEDDDMEQDDVEEEEVEVRVMEKGESFSR